MNFEIGEEVIKTGGDYNFRGWVVARFQKRGNGQPRYVVENRDGILHIFSPVQLVAVTIRPFEPEPERTNEMTNDDIDILLEIAGIKPGALWGTRIETKLEALKGTKYVDGNGQITDYGRLEIESRKKAALYPKRVAFEDERK